jgi:hypothetical protein
MVRAQPFFGYDNEDPFDHLWEFEEMCSCLSIPSMTQEILMWKLFPFSLKGDVKQWYTNVVWSMNGDWEELKDTFLTSRLCIVLQVSWINMARTKKCKRTKRTSRKIEFVVG